MELNYENFWQEYPRLVSLLLPPLEPEDGFSEAEVAAAEKRLGISLPALLREFYLRAGKRFDINHALHQLILPDKLKIRNGRFVFIYDASQSVLSYGIPLESLSLTDPPVWFTYDNGESWEEYEPSLSGFLSIMLLDQASEGMLAAGGEGNTTLEKFDEVTEGWEHFNTSTQKGAVKQGTALVFTITTSEGIGSLAGGSNVQADADFLMAELNMGFGVYDFEEEE